ncbi:hypothetical protein ACTFIR_009791 [Dictyostelium discoideum]
MIIKHKLKENKTVYYSFNIPKQYYHFALFSKNSIKIPFESYFFSNSERNRLKQTFDETDNSKHLNDEIINNMLALLKFSIKSDDVQIYNTYFSVDKINLSDIEDSSFIYFPDNVPNVHWFLVVLIIHNDSTVVMKKSAK